MKNFISSLIQKVSYRLLALFIIMTTLMVFLLTTTPGLYLVTKAIQLSVGVTFEKPEGRLIDKFQFKSLTFQHGDILIRAENVAVVWSLTPLFYKQLLIHQLHIKTLNFTHQRQLPPHFKIYFPLLLRIDSADIEQFILNIRPLSFHFNQANLKGSLFKHQIILDKLNINTPHTHLNIAATSNTTWPLIINSQAKLSPNDDLGLKGDVFIKGKPQDYQWQTHTSSPFKANLIGTLRHDELTMKAESKLWTLPLYHHAQTFTNSILTLKGKLPDWTLEAESELEGLIQGHWTVNGAQNAGVMQVSLLGQGPTYFNAHVQGRDIEHLTGDGQLNFSFLNTLIQTNLAWQAQTLHLSIKPGIWERLNFEGGDTDICFESNQLAINGALVIDPHKKLTISLKAPHYQTLDGQIDLNIDKLDFLQNFSDLIDKPDGTLNATLFANGPLFNPSFTGELTLSKGQVHLPKLGLELSPSTLLLKTNQNAWQATGEINSNGQPIHINGEGNGLAGNLFITGHQIPIIHTEEYQLVASPDLNLSINGRDLMLTGELNIPKGLIKPNRFMNTIDLTDDAVIVDTHTTTVPLTLESQINVAVAPTVILMVKGLKTGLEGDLALNKTAHLPLNVTGILNMTKGHYNAFGQKLKVKSGDLSFNHSRFDNPIIHMRATKRPNTKRQLETSGELFDFSAQNITDISFNTATEVGIEVSGHLTNPKIELFSIPSNLSQADILSLLLLGKPASLASQSGGQLLMAAISAMSLDDGNKGIELIQQLKNLGFNFSVTNNPFIKLRENPEENASFVVGKALSKRLYLSYNVGFNQPDNNVLTLQYLLNQFFSIQLTASQTGNGIDVLYRHADR